MPNPFTYLELHSADAARARPFYSALFGWKTTDQNTPAGVYTEVDPGGGPPAGMKQKSGAHAGWLPYIEVATLDASLRQAQKLGARVLTARTQIPEGAFAILEDPSGAAIGLFEKTR